MTQTIAVLPGDGIGPEIVEQAVRVLKALDLPLELVEAKVGGAAFDEFEHPLPPATLELAKRSRAVLFGAVGDWKYDSLPREFRPEQAILGLRKALQLFANLRPAILYPELAGASSLKPEIVSGLDILIIRELTGDIYFGTPRGVRSAPDGAFAGEREGFDTMRYAESEVRRIARVGFETARKRGKKLCSVDKANVLETSQFWRDLVIETARDYPDVELSHMYVDNAAMQLVRNPRQFDVIVTDNLFGDILSDAAAMLTGSLGMLPSASLGAPMANGRPKAMYEPVHGSAPDIAGQGKANPIACILSFAMALRYSYNEGDNAALLESAIEKVLADGVRTGDLMGPEGGVPVSTSGMGDAIVAALAALK